MLSFPFRASFGGSAVQAMSACAVALMMLASCREASTDLSLSGGVGSDQKADPKSKPLVVLTWDEYFSNEVVSAFERESGIAVEFVTFENLDEMEGLLRSRPSEFDLIVNLSMS